MSNKLQCRTDRPTDHSHVITSSNPSVTYVIDSNQLTAAAADDDDDDANLMAMTDIAACN